MSKIKLTGDSSGYVELSAANNAGNKTLELPTDGDKILSNNNVGIVTATTFSGNLDGTSSLAQGLTGTPNITVGNINATGTITYDDVTNIDSVGVITARSGIDVTGGLVTSDDYTITGISSSITDTAVDVFIYDTSKDSDGGAWRKRTQHTSWYNETLNTATRGSRKEFPAVAVIVAESTQLTIYDGDDPDMPMWMVFDGGSYTDFIYGLGNGPVTSIQMINAKLCVTIDDPSDQGGLDIVDFISDTGYYINESSGGPYRSNGNIKTRNDGLNLSVDQSFYNPIVNRYANDVAMTVLPNARVDVATGLPVPTIAVATDGGVSVIKDDGTVVDINRTSDDDVHHVAFDGNRVIMFMELGAIYVATIPSADQSGNPNSAWTVYGSYGGNTSGTDHPTIQAYGAGVDLVSMKDHTFATAGFNDSNERYKGLSILSENVSSSGNGMVAWAHTDFNTGWMHGDCKGAFLSDTDTTNLVEGDVLGGNGTFDDASYWTVGSSWTVSGGVATATSGSNSYLSKNGILTTGARYVIKVTVSSYSTGTLYVYCGTGAPGLQNHYFGISANGTYTMILDAYNTNFGLYSTSFAGVVDDVTVSSVVDQDRSVNGKNLGVIGTITKSVVATGAELVGYSFGSNSNYLEQPYNSDLDYGTGDMYYSMWVYASSSDTFGGNTYIFERTSIGDTSNRRIEARMTTSTRLEIYSNGQTLDNNVLVPANAWYKLDILRRSGEAFVYINGEYRSSTTGGAATGSLTDTSAKLVIGNRGYFSPLASAWPSNSKIALFRTGASGPTAVQVKKMYEDEKHLFQENAKCTLYGSSDAVTALAYDEVIDRLHVGTSSGRSDFQGLRRINNTTTAVTTAISAHDEFIIEQ